MFDEDKNETLKRTRVPKGAKSSIQILELFRKFFFEIFIEIRIIHDAANLFKLHEISKVQILLF